jgi:hypothetical protein
MDDPPMLDTSQTGSPTPAVSLDAVTTLVHSFSLMVQAMKGDLLREMERNAEMGKERWQRWEDDFKAYRESNDARVTALEGSVHEHHTKAEHDKLASEARVKPVLTTLQWLVAHWKDLAILALFLATAFVELAVGIRERIGS